MNFEEFKQRFQKVPVEEYPNNVLKEVPEPVVSCRVSTYMHEPYIRQCLDGILMQKTDFPFEIVIGEDESTDGTREICMEYAKKHPDKIRLFLHRRENNIKIGGKPSPKFQGRYSNFVCRGKYQAVCEGDDYWTDPLKLQKQVDFLEKNQDYSICYHQSMVVDQGGEVLSGQKYSDHRNRDYSSDELIKAKKLVSNTICFKNVLDDCPEESIFCFGGIKFQTSMLGNHGKGKFLDNIEPSAFRRHSGGVNSQKEGFTHDINHLKTRLSLFLYYSRTGRKEYERYFLFEQVLPKILEMDRKYNSSVADRSESGSILRTIKKQLAKRLK